MSESKALMEQHLKVEIGRLSSLIGLTGWYVPTFDNRDGAHPFITACENGELVYRAFERGEPCFERCTCDPDELLYWAFDDATARLARDWTNKQQPLVGEEYLAAKWKRRATLLHAMHPEWAERWRAELIEHLGPEGDQHLVPTLPPPPLILDPPERAPLPVRLRRWWRRLPGCQTR
ncbi:Imm63 family immunity protein [Streptomyces sp. NBC_00454]|uniref:Imm63 family immunity protein n=1 Tax=Streptomyces sp. NBC_00454 TaxID=2975747 RepID=UPI0030E14465